VWKMTLNVVYLEKKNDCSFDNCERIVVELNAFFKTL
jgi:hypothetical protein